MIRRPATWLVVLAIAAVLALLLLCVLVFPRLLHPPLSPVQLQSVASTDRRVELQQAQAKLQNDARATLLQGVAGVLLVVGVVARGGKCRSAAKGRSPSGSPGRLTISAATAATSASAASTPWLNRAHLEDSDLGHTDLREAQMEGARLTRANLSQAYLQGAQLMGADLRAAKLIGADPRGANLDRARLEGADLTDANVDATTVWPKGFKPT